MSKTMKIYEIMELLPHRYPFLLVDRVESINDDLTEIVAYKNVTAPVYGSFSQRSRDAWRPHY